MMATTNGEERTALTTLPIDGQTLLMHPPRGKLQVGGKIGPTIRTETPTSLKSRSFSNALFNLQQHDETVHGNDEVSLPVLLQINFTSSFGLNVSTKFYISSCHTDDMADHGLATTYTRNGEI